MYSSTVITALADRIGWAAPRPPASYTLTGTNAGTSGRTFDSFHKLLTVENMEACMPVSNALTAQETINNSALNAYLAEFRKQSALKVLARVFDTNPKALYQYNSNGARIDKASTDWSGLIESRISALDDCMGYQVAYDCIELILTTSRINFRERNGKENGNVRLEQQGFTDENGNTTVDGVFAKLQRAFNGANDVFFPAPPKRAIRNASNFW